MRVITVHLLNDYSGSPKVLMQLLKVWVQNKHETHLFICNGRDGFLSNIPGVKEHKYWYRFSGNIFFRLIFFFTSQVNLAIKLWFFLKKEDLVYINTVLPFGAALVAKIKGCKIIYHIHETSIKPATFKKFLFGVAKITASKVVYVSNFIAQQEPIACPTVILYNVLEKDFVQQAAMEKLTNKEEKIVLMICSLKKYKGIDQFMTLAEKNPKFSFHLVLNADPEDINSYFGKRKIPQNMSLFPAQKNTAPFYKNASIILNLSLVDSWIETFGLTILEGMCYGLPAIVPPIGGVKELVEEGVTGYCIDSYCIDQVSEKIKILFSHKDLYASFSRNSVIKSRLFSHSRFEEKSLEIISNFK